MAKFSEETLYWVLAYAQAVQEAKEEIYRLNIKMAALQKEVDRLKGLTDPL